MTGQIETLVIWFLFILKNITCSPVTLHLGEKDRQCFYIEVTEGAKYTAKVVLFSGGSVGFSEYGPTKDRRPKRIHEEKIDMISIDNSKNKSGDPPGTFEHVFSIEESEEHEICLFSDRRFGREPKHVVLDIAKTKDDAQSEETQGSNSADGLDRIGEDIKEVQELVTAIIAEQKEKGDLLVRRNQAAKDNHSSMEQSSLMETLVLVAVSVGQIIFVRRWFQGKGTLLKQWA